MSIRFVINLLFLLFVGGVITLTLIAYQSAVQARGHLMLVIGQHEGLQKSVEQLSDRFEHLNQSQSNDTDKIKIREQVAAVQNELEQLSSAGGDTKLRNILSDIDGNQNLYLLLGLNSIFVAILIAFIIRQVLLQTMQRLTQGIRAFAGEDYSHQLNLPGWQECLLLEQAYDGLAEELKSDTTEHQQTETELGQALYDKSLILASMGEAVYGLNPEGNITFANPVASEITGWSNEEITGKNNHNLLHHTRPDGTSYLESECPIYQSLQDGGVYRVDEDVFWRKNGDRFPVQYIVSPVREGNQIIGAVVVFHDISERKKSEEELDKHRYHLQELVEDQTRGITIAKDEAIRANEAKTEFLSNMSHELRTPMHAILSFSEMGEGKAKLGDIPAEKVLRYFAHINQSGQRLMKLLDALLDLSKLEAGRMELVMKKQDLRDVVTTAVAEFSEMARKRSLMLGVGHTKLDTIVQFDESKLLQVMRNLLSNSIKFSPMDGSIRISFGEVVDGSISVTVSDHGVGIPDRELKAVFDKFVQSSKTKTGAGGTGLGLSICKEIIEAHGGTIRARNNVDGGAAFTFTIPRSE